MGDVYNPLAINWPLSLPMRVPSLPDQGIIYLIPYDKAMLCSDQHRVTSIMNRNKN